MSKLKEYRVQFELGLTVTKTIKATCMEDAIFMGKEITDTSSFIRTKAGVGIEWDDEPKVTGVFE